jgi:Phage portal protein, SPP1 Gp6-like.
MYTYQDLLKIADTDDTRMEFVKQCINQHKTTDLYKTALVADSYDKHKNKTINDYQKFLYDMTGRAIPDNYSANYKMASRFFNRFITQENQYLLGNGITWGEESTKDKLGKDFDTMLQKLGRMALSGAVSFGYWNFDHLEAFSVLEFVPIYDEENGALMAGIRFWQVADDKPLRATFYEIDGYTDYIYNTKEDDRKVLREKRAYILKVRESERDGVEIYAGENYPTFPIVPLWGNPQKQSEIVGIREQIDCYDLIKSGYANNVDEGSLIYWTLQNAGGMDDHDLASFIQKMKTLHATTLDDGVTAESHNLEAPYQSREALLEKLRSDLYDDAMALDTKNIANGATTATQIKAAYEPLNSKTDQYEYCIREFIDNLLKVAGIEDEPTFTRSIIVNNQEEMQLVIQGAQFLTPEYVIEKMLNLLGDGDRAKDMIDELHANELEASKIAVEEEEEEEVIE